MNKGIEINKKDIQKIAYAAGSLDKNQRALVEKALLETMHRNVIYPDDIRRTIDKLNDAYLITDFDKRAIMAAVEAFMNGEES